MRSQFDMLSVDPHDWYARAEDALEKARAMKRGPERIAALKKAGELQVAADLKLASESKKPEGT
jgi:hypothetical protein